MAKTYHIKVNDSYTFDMDPLDIKDMDIVATKCHEFHVLEAHQSKKISLETSDFQNKSYTVKINSNTYQVVISDSLDQLIKDLGFGLGLGRMVNSVQAPMPGLILDLLVTEGQEVQEDQALLILEAMKMENIITAPRAGVVKSVNVRIGDAIEKGSLMVEFV